MKALVVAVDAADPVVQQVGDALRADGYEPAVERDIDAAPGVIEQEQLLLVVVDWATLGQAALELCRRVRDLPGGEDPFVLGLASPSQLASPAAVRDALEARVSDLVSRDALEAQLPVRLAIVARAVSRHERVRRARKLAESDAHDFRAMVEHCRDGMVVVRRGKTIYRNPFWAEHMGYSADEVAEKSYFELIAPEDRDRMRALFEVRIQHYAGRIEPWSGQLDFKVVRSDGQLRDVEAKAHSIAYGGEPATLLVMRDITERKQMEETLERRNAELSEANRQLARLARAKDQFTAMVSHELRTPLVTGVGYIELLLSGAFGPVTEKMASRMKVAHRNLRRLSSLIDSMLKYQSLMDQDFLNTPHVASFDLVALCREAMSELRVRTGRAADRDSVDLPEGPVVVLADADMLRMVLANLLNNAHVHAGETARVRLSARLVDGGARVTVSDDGRGMPPEIRARAFEPFVRAGETREGYGLGLAVVRAILTAHRCSVSLDAEEGRGTTVSFTLPVPGSVAPDARSRP